MLPTQDTIALRDTSKNPSIQPVSQSKAFARIFKTLFQGSADWFSYLIQKIRDLANTIFSSFQSNSKSNQQDNPRTLSSPSPTSSTSSPSIAINSTSSPIPQQPAPSQNVEQIKDDEKEPLLSIDYVYDPEAYKDKHSHDEKSSSSPGTSTVLMTSPAPSSSPSVSPSSTSPAIVRTYIDVPECGNSLFYVLAIGLQLIKNKEFQDKLNWKIESQLLKGNLSSSPALLANPGSQLRKQALEWLSRNLLLPPVIECMNEGIKNYNAAIQNHINQNKLKIESIEDLICTLNENFDQNYSKISIKGIEMNSLKKTNQSLEKKLINTGDFQAYLQRTSEESVHADQAHLFAICQMYGVPIKVLQSEFPGREKVYLPNNNKDNLSLFTIECVRGNHYRYVE